MVRHAHQNERKCWLAMGREARPPELDRFAGAFSVAGENQEKAMDEETLVLLKRFSRNPDIEKGRAEFERAQKVEEQFHSEFDGLDFTNRSSTLRLMVRSIAEEQGNECIR